MPNNDSHQHVVKTSEQWNDRIVEFWVVPRGCLCVELTPKGKTKIKIGEGNKYYSQLPYICEGHDLSQYYTKDEIDNLFDNLNRMAIMSTDEYDSKSDLPMNDNKLGDVRFVKSSSPSIKSDPDIYLWDGSKWVFVGYEFKDIDLSQYLKKDEFHEMFDPVKEQVDEMYPMRHTHENKDVLDQITAPYTIPEKEKLAGLENYDDTEIRQLIHDTGHTHPNKDILDTITSESLWSESDREKFDSLHNYDDSEVKVRIEILESKSHTHDNKDILDQITAPFTTEDKTKLDSLHNDDVFRGTDGMYPGSEGNVPAPSVLDVGKFLSSDGTWKSAGSDVDFIGATSTTDGYHGLVPAPMAGEETYFLKGDGTWARIKQGGDKYKAGEGIYILSGEVTSDTFPFEIYSRSQKIKQYIIYGNINGVGDLVNGKYQIPIRVSAQGYTDRISTITIDDPLYEGDYIDFQKQVFAHYKTNITSQITNPSTDTRATGINSNGELYWKSSFNGWGGAPRVTDYIEIEEGANYEITHTYPSNDFSNALNVNVYDANKNRTRTIITSRESSTLFSPTSNEKYFRYSYCAEGDGYSNVLRLKPVETPCILQEIILYPNAINTVNIDTTTKPNEVYFEVEEPEEIDPDDPMAQFSGIIYNDGVLDITQEDPDNLNILTIHFRDDVTKDITINAGVDECVVDITQEDPDNLNELTITYADGDTTTITIPTGEGEYYPGQGIEFTHPGSELYRVVEYIKKPKGVTVTTDVIPSGTTDFRCDMKYFSYIGRFTILAHNGERGSFCFSPPATNQSSASTRMWMYSAHEVWEDLYLTVSSYSVDPVVAHLRWGYTMSISYDHISNTAQRTTDILPGTNNVGFNSECDTSYYWAKFYENDILVGDLVPVIRDSDNTYGFFNKITNVFSTADGAMSAGPETGEVITIGDPSEKHITAKLGIGLTFDANDAIELDDTIKIKLNCNNEPD